MRITLSIILLFIGSVLMVNAQSKRITGTVTDETGGGLPGVTVQVKGTTVGTITDIEGNYSLDAGSDAVLVYSFIGYLSQEIPVNNRSQINTSLELDVKQLEEVVVVGYGTMKKSDLTGAVTSMDSEDVAQIRSANVVEVMQGKAAGVDISRESGRAGAGYDIKIRGTRSITASNDPLYVVDGVPYGENVAIDPNDIESIEILKDASSTAIYGSRGANGVVLITTKKGSKGKGQVSFNMYSGVTQGVGEVPMADAEYFLQLYDDLAWARVRKRDPSAPPVVDGYKNEMRAREDENVDIDWYDLLLRQGSQENYNLSFAGASDKLTYSTSASYYRERGLLEGDDFKRYTLRLNLEGKMNDYISVGTSSLSSMIINERRGSPLGDARKLSPLSSPYDSAGNIIGWPRFPVEVANPLISADPNYYYRETRTGRLFNTFYANLSLLDNALNFRSSVNLDMDFTRDGTFNGIFPGISGQSTSEVSQRIGTDFTFQNVLNFDKSFGGIHSLKLTAGSEVIYRRDERYRTAVQDLGLGNSQWYALSSASASNRELTTGGDYPLQENKLVSFFGRAHYGLLDRYLFQVTGRYDASSVLSEENRWAFFPSASFAWRITEEPFFPEQPVLTDAKLRVGYGVSGNQAVSPYSSRGKIVPNPLYYEFGVSETAINAYRTQTNENVELGWESTKALNIGLDVEFWQGRMSAAVEYYITQTDDLLLEQTLSPHSGITSITANVGSTENKGFEVSLNATVVQTRDFSWKTTVTYYKNDEKITALSSGVQEDVVNRWFVGSPVEVYYDQEFDGIWQIGEEDQAALYGAEPGDIKFKDPDFDPADSVHSVENVIIGTPRPEWVGGWTNTFTYKGFDLSIVAFTRQGHMIRDRVRSQFAADGLSSSTKLNYWTPTNPSNETPGLDPTQTLSGWSDIQALEFTDGSFFKIRDITLGYTLPANIMDNIGVSKLRVYFSVKNALIWSDYGDFRGFGGKQNRNDPEIKGSIDLPMPRMFAGGLNLTF